MKKLISVFSFVFLLFSSCNTTMHLPIPGENAEIKASIYQEYLTIADEYLELKKYEKAATYYKKALKSKKLYWSAYYKLGRTYALNKNWDESLSIYKKILKRDKNNSSIKAIIAYIYASKGDLTKASSMYEQLWNENSDNAETLVNYINVLFVLEKYEDAENYFLILKEKFSDDKNISAFETKFSDYHKTNDENNIDSELKNPLEEKIN